MPLALLLLLLLPSMCLAEINQEQAADLQELKMHITTLQTNNESLADNFKASMQELEIAKQHSTELERQAEISEVKIAKLEAQLIVLKTQIGAAKNLSIKTETSLKDANSLLETYNKEEQKKLAQANREKKEWQIIAIGVSIYCAFK